MNRFYSKFTQYTLIISMYSIVFSCYSILLFKLFVEISECCWMLDAGNDVEIELIVRVANCLPCCFSCKTVSSASGCQRSFIIRKPFIKSPSCVPEQNEGWIPVHFSDRNFVFPKSENFRYYFAYSHIS